MRFYRSPDMDELSSQDPGFRDDDLREIVDQLPPLEREIIERCYFGGEDLAQVASDLGVSEKHCRKVRQRGIDRISRIYTGEEDQQPEATDCPPESFLPAVTVDCDHPSPWGPCNQQVAPGSGWCTTHARWAERGTTPDEFYHRKLVLGQIVPADNYLADSELHALINGRYRGDGRRIDQYVTSDPIFLEEW